MNKPTKLLVAALACALCSFVPCLAQAESRASNRTTDVLESNCNPSCPVEQYCCRTDHGHYYCSRSHHSACSIPVDFHGSHVQYSRPFIPIWVILLFIIALTTYIRRNQHTQSVFRMVDLRAVQAANLESVFFQQQTANHHNQQQQHTITIPLGSTYYPHTPAIGTAATDNTDLPQYNDLDSDLPSYKAVIMNKY